MLEPKVWNLSTYSGGGGEYFLGKSSEKVFLSLESKGRAVQTEGRRMLIKFLAELGETARESEQQIGSVDLPGRWASAPEQLLILSHNTNRLAGGDTESCGWQRSEYVFTLFPCLENWICILGRRGFPVYVVCVCVCVCVRVCACVCVCV